MSAEAALSLSQTCDHLWPPDQDDPRAPDEVVRIAEQLARADLVELSTTDGLVAWLRFTALMEMTMLGLAESARREDSALLRRLRRAVDRVDAAALAGAWKKGPVS